MAGKGEMTISRKGRTKTCRCGHGYDSHECRYDPKLRNYRFTRDGNCTECECKRFVGVFCSDDERSLFNKGDRVVLSDKSRDTRMLKGTVIGYGDEFDLIRIRIDGKKTPETWRSWGWKCIEAEERLKPNGL